MEERDKKATSWYYYENYPPGQQCTFTRKVFCTLDEVYKEYPGAYVRGNIVYITRS